jgi:Xaa-Pro aminopeptidase
MSTTKLEKIRELMKEKGYDGYLVLHGDAHNSEYLAALDERVAYISGFKGSNGLCFITQTGAWMWTDGRYFLQAEKQLDEGWKMMKMGREFKPYF